MTPVPLAQLDLTPVQDLLLGRLDEGPLPFAALVEFVRGAERLADEATLPIRLDQALWPLLDGGWILFERAEVPIARWADVIPTVQLLERGDAEGAEWVAGEAVRGLTLTLQR